MAMNLSLVADGVFRLSANARNLLFEGLWPLPHGVAMNSFIVKGDKVAIVDGVCGWDGVPETLFRQLDLMGVAVEDIEYVVVNHMEPDHTGWLDAFRRIRGDGFTLIATEKAIALYEAFYGAKPVNYRVAKDGDLLTLGGSKMLRFIEIPNVHWPDTMLTFEEETGTLFGCDVFGSYGAVEEAPYDDLLSPEELAFFEAEGLRYFSNIIGAFSFQAAKALERVEALLGDRVKIVAPGHGIVWRKDPGKVIADYARWARWQKAPDAPCVTLIWGSMYGNTELGAAAAREALAASGLEVREHRVPESHISDILASVWKSSAVVLAMPTYEYKMFPPMAEVLDELGRKRAHNRLAFRLGSFGWSGGAQAELDEIVGRHKMGWKFLEPVEFKGRPAPEHLALIEERCAALAAAVRELGAGKSSPPAAAD